MLPRPRGDPTTENEEDSLPKSKPRCETIAGYQLPIKLSVSRNWDTNPQQRTEVVLGEKHLCDCKTLTDHVIFSSMNVPPSMVQLSLFAVAVACNDGSARVPLTSVSQVRGKNSSTFFLLVEHKPETNMRRIPTDIVNILEKSTVRLEMNGFTFALSGQNIILEQFVGKRRTHNLADRKNEEVSVVGFEWETFMPPRKSEDKHTVAALVSGESGSGKSVLAATLLQRKILQMPQWGLSDEEEPVRFVRIVMRESSSMLRELDERRFETDDEKAERNRLACEAVEKMLKDQVLREEFTGMINRLVVVVDEVGVCLNLARGCVAAAAENEEDRSLISFAKKVFFIFCGTSVEYADTDIDSERPANLIEATGRKTTELARNSISSNADRVIFIRMRSACKAFYTATAIRDEDKANVETIFSASNIITALMGNTRAGCSVIDQLQPYNKISLRVLKAMSSDLLKTIGTQYAHSNGIGRLIRDHEPRVVQQYWRTALSTVMNIPMPDTPIPRINVVRIGMMSWDESFAMTTALISLCLCQFGQSVTPAVDWSSYEQLCFSCVYLQHLVESADPSSVNCLHLNSPFPSESDDIVQIPSILKKALENLPCGSTLVVLNGDKAPFADVFSVRHCPAYIDVKLIQCKCFLSLESSLQPAEYTAELLKWSLRPKVLPGKTSDAKRVADSFPDNVTSSLRSLGAVVSRAALETIAKLVGDGSKPLHIHPIFCFNRKDAIHEDCSKEVQLLQFHRNPENWTVDCAAFSDLGPLQAMVDNAAPEACQTEATAVQKQYYRDPQVTETLLLSNSL